MSIHETNTAPKLSLQDYMKKLEELIVNGMGLSDLHKLRGTIEAEGVGQEEGGTFSNVAEHTAMAMLITDVLGDKLGLSLRERGDLNVAAWLHDSGKKTERMWQRAIEEAENDAESDLVKEEDGSLSAAGMRKKQALRETASMEEWENAEVGVSPRSNRLMKENIPDSQEGHGADLAAKIMWFADACLTGTKIQPINQRFNDLESDVKNGARNIAFSDSFKDQYDGKSLYQVQRSLGEKYETEFAQRLGIPKETLYSWLDSAVSSRIQSQQLPILPQD